MTIEPIVLRAPNRIADWLVSAPERLEFLVDTLFTMRNQYPDTELTVELVDDDTVRITPADYEPQEYRVSEHRAIAETLEPIRNRQSYAEFVKNYTDWRGRFQSWWHSWQAFIGQIRACDDGNEPKHP